MTTATPAASAVPCRSRRAGVLVLVVALLAAATLAGAATASATVEIGWRSTDDSPTAIAMDAAGNLYTSNFNADTVTRIDADGADPGPPYRFSFAGDGPQGIAVDRAGFIYTANTNDSTISRIDPANPNLVGPSSWVTLAPGSQPQAIAIDPAGNVYTANANNTVSKVTSAGVVTDAFGTTGTNPQAIAVDAAGTVYTANANDDTITRITADGHSTAAWATLVSASMCGPSPCRVGAEGLVLDGSGNLYVAGYNYGDVFRVAPDGAVTELAHDRTLEFWGITRDAAGNLYAVANYDESSSTNSSVARITPAGAMSVLSETGHGAMGVVLAASGTLFTADASDDSVSRITAGGGTPVIAPPAPETPAAPAAAIRGRTATITITPNPTSAVAGAPTSYVVHAVGDPATTCTVTAPATSCSIAGLKTGVTYRFVATAVLLATTTAESDPSNAVMPTAATPTVAANAVRVPAALARRGLAVSSADGLILPLLCPGASTGGCSASGDLSIVLPASLRARSAGGRSALVRVLARFRGEEVEAGKRRLVTLRLDAATCAELRAAGIRRIPAILRMRTRLADGTVLRGHQRVWLRFVQLAPVAG